MSDAASEGRSSPPGAGLPTLHAVLERGLTFHRAGRFPDAAAAYRQILERTPWHADALHLLGLTVCQTGDHGEALGLIDRAIEQAPANADFWNSRGAVLLALGRAGDAMENFDRAVSLQPRHADAHRNIGLVLRDAGRLGEAEQHYRFALEINPDHADARLRLGMVLRQCGQLEAAEAQIRLAVEEKQDFAEAHHSLGIVLKESRKPDEAEAAFRSALACEPDYTDAMVYIALLCQKQGRLSEAEQTLRCALDIQPDYAQVHCNLGAVLQSAGRLEEAERSFRRALTIKPDYAECRWNLGVVNLLQGRFRSGWAGFEYRQQIATKAVRRPDLGHPEWCGESLAGRRILMVGEQGLGDQIQFIRYARVLEQQGAQVDVVVVPALLELLEGAAGVHKVMSSFPTDRYDYWSLMLSVPGRLGTDLTNMPAEVPYLRADGARVQSWRDRLNAAANGRRKIALIWAGDPSHQNDRFRSMKLDDLAPLAGAGDIAWFSLQTGAAQMQLPGADHFIEYPLGDELHGFADTAAVVENLDLVISVDTSVIHLAGALGKPAWLLLPANPDWRWLTERTDSPWYPSLRLFRQTRLGDWTPVVAEVRRELKRIGSVVTR